jgi:hypothetical protein
VAPASMHPLIRCCFGGIFSRFLYIPNFIHPPSLLPSGTAAFLTQLISGIF